MWTTVGAILIVGILVTVTLYIICYKISQFYVSKQYILREIESGNKTKIVGDAFDITYNDNLVHVQKEEDDTWTYSFKNKSEEQIKLLEGEYIEIEDIKFEIVAKSKMGLIILLPIGVITISSVLLLSQGINLINRDKQEEKTKETTELNDGNIKDDETTELSETILADEGKESEENRQENEETQEGMQLLEENDRIVDMHTMVLENEDMFQNSRMIDWTWEYEGDSDNMRRFLKNTPSEIGINVSVYQETIDWEKVRADGIDFAIIRIGSRGYESGEIHLDSKFEENMEGAINNGIKTGAYFFSQATNQKEMDEEIDEILKALDGYSLDYPVGIELDCEEKYRTNELSTTEHLEEYIDLIKYFCIRIKQNGYTPMIFGHMEWFQQFPEGIFDGYYKWIYSPNSAPDSIDNCIIWQYRMNTKGKVDGIDDKLVVSVNLSVFKKESD